MSNDELTTVYTFEGNNNSNNNNKQKERVPESVEKLIVKEGVRVLTATLCSYSYRKLRQVSLPHGLTRIEFNAFSSCESLSDIFICKTVEYIGHGAFEYCEGLAKVEFESSTSSSPHQLQTISDGAFSSCISLERIKLPSLVSSVGTSAFSDCHVLIEANLSTTEVVEISNSAFAQCYSLLTASLPSTLEWIGDNAFDDCSELVTVVVSLHSQQPIWIGEESFYGCRRLANFCLPKDSTAEEDSFVECELLHKRYGEESSRIVAGLIGRFQYDSVFHRLCYYHSGITHHNLRQMAQHPSAEEVEQSLLLDDFLMTPLHVLFSTPEPNLELLEFLLDHYRCHLLNVKDANGNRPFDYLIKNWTSRNVSLLQPMLQKWMVDPLKNWGARSWMQAMETKVGSLLFALLFNDDKGQKVTLFNEVYSDFSEYEWVETKSLLELALWKVKMKSGRNNDDSKRQALDRVECRCVCGSEVVIPLVTSFL